MRMKDVTISARFMVTMGHFIALLLLFSTYKENVSIGLSDNASSSEQHTAERTAQGALIFGSFCFMFDFIGMFFGTSIFYSTVNVCQILLHFIGSILLSWVITQHWSYRAMWPIVACTNIPAAIIEAHVIIGIYVWKIYKP